MCYNLQKFELIWMNGNNGEVVGSFSSVCCFLQRNLMEREGISRLPVV